MKNSFVPLVIGVDGLIGNAIWQKVRDFYPGASGTSRKGTDGLPFFDIRSSSFEEIDRPFTHAFLTGANPNIRACELDPAGTAACNLGGTIELARWFAARGIQPILFSTDYVFDGIQGSYSEEAPLSPLNQYGWQKAELERTVSEATSGFYLMIRLGKVFLRKGAGGGLLGEMADLLRRKEKVRAAADQIFTPVLLDDVVDGIFRLVQLKSNGLYNLGGVEKWSRFDLAREIAQHLKADLNLIEPISLDDLNEPFKRPKKTVLVSTKFVRESGLEMRRLSQIISEIFQR